MNREKAIYRFGSIQFSSKLHHVTNMLDLRFEWEIEKTNQGERAPRSVSGLEQYAFDFSTIVGALFTHLVGEVAAWVATYAISPLTRIISGFT